MIDVGEGSNKKWKKVAIDREEWWNISSLNQSTYGLKKKKYINTEPPCTEQ